MPIALLENISLVVLAGLAYSVLLRVETAWIRALGTGVLFGATALLACANPVTMPGGATIDARAGPVLFAGFLGGPIAGVLAALLGAYGRVAVGGPFVISAVVAFLLYGVLGAGWGALRTGGAALRTVTYRDVVVLVLTSIAAASGMFFLIQPEPRAMYWLSHDFPVVAVANCCSVGVLGLTLRAVGSARDVSRRLMLTAERLQLASEAARIGVWDYDVVSGQTRWDTVQAQLHGLKAEDFDVSYAKWTSLLHPEDRARMQVEVRAALTGETTFDTEFRIVTPSGETRHLRGCATVVRNTSGDPIRMVGVNYDITQLRVSQEALRKNREMLFQAQKLEAVGRLSGGIAHDFNNLLSVVLGNLSLALAEAPEATELHAALQDALTAAQRGAKLTDQLLAFSRRAPLRPEVVEPISAVDNVLRLLRRTIPTTIALQLEADDETDNITVDRTQLESALLNLAINAKDALEDGGTITVEVANADLDAMTPDERPFGDGPLGPHVRITVRDDGTGMSDEVRSRAFEPFFTTKEVGMGSGMGLAMVEGFVRQSKGRLRLHSAVSEGTRFDLFFPATTEDRRRRSTPGEGLVGGTERILLVEDDAAVLRTFARGLRRHGYDVLEATGGAEAIARLESNETIDIVITDVIMPHVGGLAVLERARALRPAVPVVLVSGYLGKNPPGQPGFDSGDIVLRKPVQGDELLRAIRASLDAKKRSPSYAVEHLDS